MQQAFQKVSVVSHRIQQGDRTGRKDQLWALASIFTDVRGGVVAATPAHARLMDASWLSIGKLASG